ncbi:MAG: amidase family protein [Syntrophobacteraceae bacterium]
MKSETFSHLDTSPRPCVNGGILSGKRAAVQASISVKGWPTEAGSLALRGFVSLEDATVIERLRAAGSTLVGNTRSSELGFGLLGDGTARALGEGHVDFALMTDTMGEARVAAARAGLIGFKPSYGRISRFGLVGMVPSMDCCSILGTGLEDVASVFRAIEGRDDRDPSMSDCRRPASQRDYSGKSSTVSAGIVSRCIEILDTGERQAFREMLDKLRDVGIHTREVPWEDFDLFSAAHNLIGTVEASSCCGKFDGVRYGHCASGSKNWNEMYLQSRAESFSLVVKAYLFQGAYFQFKNYPAFERACGIRARLADESRRLLGDLDLLIFPTRRAAVDIARADTVEQLYEPFSLTLPANVTGQPALTLPGFLATPDGDLGLQMVGPLFGDERLFEVAKRLYQRTEGAG